MQQFFGSGSSSLFVVSVWRSGSSLLYALLNQHPQIALMYEEDLLVLKPTFGRRSRNDDWLIRWDLWNHGLRRHQLDPARLACRNPDVETAISTVCREYACSKAAVIWGCKSPNYYNSFARLAIALPNARFIIIWRDPADTCRSVFRAGRESSFFARRGMAHRALMAFEELKRETHKVVRLGNPVYQLHYEDLIRNPKQELMGICNFLQVPYDPRMTHLDRADRSAIYEGEHHARLKEARVSASPQRSEVLPPAFKSKVERYLVYWQRKYGNGWLRSGLHHSCKEPSLGERLSDRLIYWMFRTRDSVMPFVFRNSPLWLLNRYRAMMPVVRRPRRNAVHLGSTAGLTREAG